jgi:beta-glucosidase
MIHHVLLSHGKATRIIREHAKLPSTIGWAPAVGVSIPENEYTKDPEVLKAAEEAQFHCDLKGNTAMGSSIWCDPVFLKRYPQNFVDAYASYLPESWEEDLEIIGTPIDFCGQNIYAAWGGFTRDEDGKVVYVNYTEAPNGNPRTLFGWPVTPEALYWGPKWFHQRYNIPIVITENGLSGHDWVHLDGKVHDPHRIDFTTRYLRALKRAAADGVPVQGYFHWSLMDNFEWAEGYIHRFGLIHVDMNTKVRTPKESSKWYRTVIESNGRDL